MNTRWTARTRPTDTRSATKRRIAGGPIDTGPVRPAWRGAPTHAEIRWIVDRYLQRVAKRNRRGGSLVLDRTAWFVFWIVKVIAMSLTPPAIWLLLELDGYGLKGYLASLLIAMMAMSFLLKDGFNARQWRERDYCGLNQVIHYMGQILLSFSLAAAVAWTVLAPFLGALF